MTGQSNWFWVCPRCQTSNATGVCRSCGTPAPPPPIAPSVAPQRAKRQQTTAQKAAIGIGVVVVAVIGLVAWSVTGRHGPTQPAARQLVEEPAPPVARSLTDSQLKAAVTDNIRVLYADSDWYPYVELANGTLDVAARDGVVFIGGVPPSLADSACRSIAAASYDDEAIPLGIHAVVMVYDSDDVARCRPVDA